LHRHGAAPQIKVQVNQRAVCQSANREGRGTGTVSGGIVKDIVAEQRQRIGGVGNRRRATTIPSDGPDGETDDGPDPLSVQQVASAHRQIVIAARGVGSEPVPDCASASSALARKGGPKSFASANP